MCKEINFVPAAAVSAWDDTEVSPVCYVGNDAVEVCEEGEENFYSLYLHQVEGGVQCIADLPTKELATDLEKLLQNAISHYSVAPEKPSDLEIKRAREILTNSGYFVANLFNEYDAMNKYDDNFKEIHGDLSEDEKESLFYLLRDYEFPVDWDRIEYCIQSVLSDRDGDY